MRANTPSENVMRGRKTVRGGGTVLFLIALTMRSLIVCPSVIERSAFILELQVSCRARSDPCYLMNVCSCNKGAPNSTMVWLEYGRNCYFFPISILPLEFSARHRALQNKDIQGLPK